MKPYLRIHLLLIVWLLTAPGCVGYEIPHLWQRKPATYIHGGEEFGRDQLLNRTLVGQLKAVPMKGKVANEVVTLLGEPQEVEIRLKDVSEDWYYVYYRNYKLWPDTPKGSFVVRFYHGKVIDVVTLD